MSFAVPQTPQRPLPGAFLQTPAPSRYPSGPDPQTQLFQTPSSAGQQSNVQHLQGSNPGQQMSSGAPQTQSLVQAQPLSPVQRAARTINECQLRDARFPEIESYVRQGISSDYSLPTSPNDAAWSPLQKSKVYAIPDRIFEQYNHAQVSTMMGLFAELNHAWITIDNCLYLWDYTQTNPDLIGFEEQPNSITAIKLVIPRPGVFVPAITHVLVVATTLDILLLGVSVSLGSNGIRTISLYQTRMSLSIKGIDVRVIEGSSASGRIFFAGGGDNEVYELTYQQEEKWFANRCGKVNHTTPGYSNLMPTSIWTKKSPEHVIDMVIDDTRNLLYTLSSESGIRIFHMNSPDSLQKAIDKSKMEVLRDISHMITMSQTPLLGDAMRIVSISPIPANESSKLHLMATTSSGCRLFLSATRGYNGATPDRHLPPASMQVQHIKFPPPPQQPPQRSGQLITSQNSDAAIDTGSRALEFTRRGLRYPPGLFLCFVTKDALPGRDVLFLSAPDTGRIASQAQSVAGSKYYEQGVWQNLESRAEAVGLVTKPYSAAPGPLGFGNELAVQFDEPSTEIAILTNTGVHTFRRRRLVDMFAAALRNGGGDEGLEGEVIRFIQRYGRGETIAAALAVACGQGAEVSSTDFRLAKVSDPVTLELAKKAFVEFGGKPVLKDNVDGSQQPVDNVRPSARHEGLALYVARLVRSIWKAEVILQQIIPGGAVAITSSVSPIKLRSVQDDLSKLDKFLDNNSTFIEGLNGAEGLSRAPGLNEEKALQGEHQALNSLQVLIKSIIEGISFVLMLFEERVDELWVSLDDVTRQRLRNLTYESLFASADGTDLGKVLVKAIVNRNIANGSNVDAVAEALRRKCRSFCSAEDVDVFRAQEQLRRASEIGPNTDLGRKLLNGSLQLFEGVAESLSYVTLQTAIQQYVALQFYAGAIQLALKVAQKMDPANRALAWYNEGKPERDSRADLYERRKRCYDLVHDILTAVDAAASGQPLDIDGRITVIAKKRNEAHDIVNSSDDELFQYGLYDWYLREGRKDRLLEVDTPYVISFLERKSSEIEHRDLLAQYYAKWRRFYDAAVVQTQLAKSDLNLTLRERIDYLSAAKANSLTSVTGVGRQARQVLVKEVSDLLELANIQDEILTRLKKDSRIEADREQEINAQLNGKILDVSTLYNDFADNAGYFDICLLIYQAADHRNPAHIEATWMNLVEAKHVEVENKEGQSGPQKPYEAIIEVVQKLSHMLGYQEAWFPPYFLVPLIERYSVEAQRGVGPPGWVIDLFLSVTIPHATLFEIIKNMLTYQEAPFIGRVRDFLAEDMFYLIKKWYAHCRGSNQQVLFGSNDKAQEVVETLHLLMQSGLGQTSIEAAQILKAKIERELRW